MLLAEGPRIDGGLLLVLLALFVAVVALVVAGAVLGCVWAQRAGRGSRPALVGAVGVGFVEAYVLVAAIVSDGPVAAVVAAGLLVVQGALYARGRRRRAAPSVVSDTATEIGP